MSSSSHKLKGQPSHKMQNCCPSFKITAFITHFGPSSQPVSAVGDPFSYCLQRDIHTAYSTSAKPHLHSLQNTVSI